MPSPSPSPAATMMVMEITPQAMQNIVSIVRRLCAHSVASVSRNKSLKFMALRLSPKLLQNDLLLFVEAFEDFGLHAVGDAEFHAEFLFTVLAFRVGNFDRGFAILVVNHRGFRNHQHILLFFEQDFRS